MNKILSLLLIMCGHLAVSGQERSLTDSLSYRAEMQATMTSGDYTPLWLNANKYGLSSLKTANGYLRGTIERPLTLDEGRKWGFGYGADVAVSEPFLDVFQRNSVRVKQTGTTVSKIMEANPPHSMLLKEVRESRCQILWLDQFPKFVHEDVIHVVLAVTASA